MNQGGDILGRCFELAGAGRLDEAGDLAEQALESEGDDGGLWRFVGMMRHREGDFRGARDALETAQALVPFDPSTCCALAESLARTGHPESALEVYAALTADRRCPEGLLPAIAAGLGYLGENGRALDVCVELIRRRPDLAEAYFGAAFYLRRLGRPPADALPCVARAHELAPDVALYRVSLAALLDHAGRGDEARDLLRGVDLDGVSCRCCLRWMTTIFLAADVPARGGPAAIGSARGPRPGSWTEGCATMSNLIDLTDATIPSPAEGRRVETLAKTDAFELKRLSLAKGFEIPEHYAPGPITVQCLVGRVTFMAGGEPNDLSVGRLIHLSVRVPHSLKAEEDSVVLVTKMSGR